MPQSKDIGQNSDGGTSNFKISGQSLMKGNGHNSRISYCINIKPKPVTNLDKENKTTSKKIDYDVILEHWTSLSFFHFIEQESGLESAKLTFSLITTFYFTKTENKTKKPLTQLSHYCFE